MELNLPLPFILDMCKRVAVKLAIHWSVNIPHWKFLRFAFQGVCYEYRILPFGFSLSLRVFVCCTEAAVAPLRRQSIRLATYLEDWLQEFTARSCSTHVRAHAASAGTWAFIINGEKSKFSPAQDVVFLGLALNSVSLKAFRRNDS